MQLARCEAYTVMFLALVLLLAPSSAVASSSHVEIRVAPLYATFSGADLHILDEVLSWDMPTASGIWSYGADVTPQWFFPGPSIGTVVELTASIDSTVALVMEGTFLRWSDSAGRRFTAPPPGADGTLYRNSVFLWDGDFRLPDQRQFDMPNVSDPSGWSPITWHAEAGIGLASGTVTARTEFVRQRSFRLLGEVGLGLLRVEHEFDRNVSMTAEVVDDLDGDYSADDLFHNDITLDHRASSRGIAAGPMVGVRLMGGLSTVQLVLSASQGWVRGSFDLTSRFVDIDNIRVDYNQDGTWDGASMLYGDVPCSQPVSVTIPVTQVSGSITYAVGTGHVGVAVYHGLYRGVPVSPDFSYRDLTVNLRTQDIAISGLAVSLSVGF